MKNGILRQTVHVLVAAGLLASLAACGGSTKAPEQAAETVQGVRVEPLRLEMVPDEVEAPGTVQSTASAGIAARVMGTVVQVAVREGDAVRQGQLLVQLDERELGARRNAARAALEEAAAMREEAVRGLAAAEAQAELAKKTFERFEFLRKEKSVSPQEFDEVAAKHRAAQALLAGAQARRQQVEAMNARTEAEARAAETMAGYARVTAPFDGVVVRRSVEAGAMASPGMELLVVEETSRYRVAAAVDATTATARGIRRGTKARVRLDALPGKEFEGVVTELEAGVDASSQTVQAKVDLPRDAALRSGLFGRVLFCCGERKALTVARKAVVERGQLEGVYAVGADQIARLRLVTLGRAWGERVEVLSGLSEGERIVVEPGGRELDGRRMEARP